MKNKKTFIIPVSELTTEEEAHKTIATLVSEYTEEIHWDDATGLIYINGSTNINNNKYENRNFNK